jgi:hypothetical protein
MRCLCAEKEDTPVKETKTPPKQPYTKPTLTKHKALRDITAMPFTSNPP